jgi:hypothetical protein
MVVWMLTAGIGIYLLAAGIAAQRRAAGGAQEAAAGGARPDDGGAGPPPGGESSAPLAPGPDGGPVVGAGVLASITAPGGGAAAGSGGPGAGAEGSPLLEFVHPLLALTGLMFWIFFVMTDDRPFAWIAFGVVVATVLAGLSWAVLPRWLARRAARRGGREPGDGLEGGFPAHLIMIHGLAAACTLTLVVIAAVTAAHR